MITFIACVLLLILGYIFYGKFVERNFNPDDRQTPAYAMQDGVDYVPMPTWKVFLSYFKNGLCKLLENRIDFSCKKIPQNLPRDFWINHIASSFIETVRWWNKNKMRETPQQITEYFELAIKTKA